MLFSYTASVILLSLAMLGLWMLLRDLWQYFIEPKLLQPSSATILLVVEDLQLLMGEVLYYLAGKIPESPMPIEVVIVDCSAQRLTGNIASQLAAEYPFIRVFRPVTLEPIAEVLPECQGAVIYVFDTVNRMTQKEFFMALCAVFRQ